MTENQPKKVQDDLKTSFFAYGLIYVIVAFFGLPMVFVFMLLIRLTFPAFTEQVEPTIPLVIFMYTFFFLLILNRKKIFPKRNKKPKYDVYTYQDIITFSESEEELKRCLSAELIGEIKDSDEDLIDICKKLSEDESYKVREQAFSSLKKLNVQ